MKRTLVSILIIAQTGFFTMGFSVASATQSVDKVNITSVSRGFVTNQVVVELASPLETRDAAQKNIFSQVVSGVRPVPLGITKSSHIRKHRGFRYTLTIADGTDPRTVARKLLVKPGVVSATPNFIYHVAQTSNDPSFQLKDDLYNTGANSGRSSETKDADLDAELAWKTTRGSGAVVAVVDTGVQMDHPDLQDNIWTNTGETASNSIDDDANTFVDDVHGWDFVDSDNDPNPSGVGVDKSHGTHVAGIIAAELGNDVGIAGVAPEAKIMPVRAFASNGSATTDNVLNAIDYAVQNGADVVNMSFTTDPTFCVNGTDGEGHAFGPTDCFDASFNTTLQDAYNANVVLVAAAGNDNVNISTYPISPVSNDCGGTNCVIGVAAVSNSDVRASYSNYSSSSSNKYVDVSAPGGELSAGTCGAGTSRCIYSTVFSSTYEYELGTSMAAPQVAGVAALVRATNDSMTAANVISTIRNYSDPNLSGSIGAGRVNAAHAVNASIMTRFDGGGGGANRYDVAVQTSTLTFPVDGSATTVAIASGTSFADGLAGSGMARFKNGPLLLTNKAGLTSGTLTEIQRVLGNTTKQIYILGGTAAVSSNIETQLDDVGYTNHTRVIGGGTDRVDTALGIANISNPGTVTEAIMVNKDNFPDGVSASAVTAKRNIPLLVNASNGLDSRNATWLTTHHVARVYVVGGTSVISTTIENQLHALSISTTRLANTDRYGTSAEVAKCFFSTTSSSVCNGVTSGRLQPKQVGFAVGTNFPDALSGGPYMGFYGGPMLLVQSTAVPTFIQNYNTLVKGSARDGFIFGGTSAINNTVSSTLASELK